MITLTDTLIFTLRLASIPVVVLCLDIAVIAIANVIDDYRGRDPLPVYGRGVQIRALPLRLGSAPGRDTD